MDNTKRSEALSIVSDLPLSKFGLGSDNSDLIVLIIKYFRIVGLVFFVWLFGLFNFWQFKNKQIIKQQSKNHCFIYKVIWASVLLGFYWHHLHIYGENEHIQHVQSSQK
jgi:hypothetical protein